MVKLQNGNRYAPFGGDWYDPCSVKPKMLIPSLCSWIEKGSQVFQHQVPLQFSFFMSGKFPLLISGTCMVISIATSLQHATRFTQQHNT